MNTRKANAEEAEKLAKLLVQAETHPMMRAIMAEKAAAILATRTEAAGKIEVAKRERDEVIPQLLSDRAAKEENFKRAKAALDTAGGEYNAARFTLSSRGQSFDHTISGQEQTLIESADPAIDAAIIFFKGKLDWLRAPERISTTRRGAIRNIHTEKITTKVETNYDAINAALRYCMDAVAELQRMKLDPVLDVEKIERMSAGIPSVDIFSEFTGEKPMPGSRGMPLIRPRFGGAASDEYEQTLLDRVHKKAKDFLKK